MLGQFLAKRQLFIWSKGIHLQYEHWLHRSISAAKSSNAIVILLFAG
jgi:hypothetical protein